MKKIKKPYPRLLWNIKLSSFTILLCLTITIQTAQLLYSFNNLIINCF